MTRTHQGYACIPRLCAPSMLSLPGIVPALFGAVMGKGLPACEIDLRLIGWDDPSPPMSGADVYYQQTSPLGRGVCRWLSKVRGERRCQ